MRVTQAEGDHDFDWAVWAEPRLEAVVKNKPVSNDRSTDNRQP